MQNVMIAAAILALLLAGCAPTMSPEAVASVKTEIETCYKEAKTYVGAARCQNAVLAPFYQGDLANVVATERVAVAEKRDNGTLTQAGAEAELARVIASTNSERQQRNAAIAASMPASCTTVGATTTCY